MLQRISHHDTPFLTIHALIGYQIVENDTTSCTRQSASLFKIFNCIYVRQGRHLITQHSCMAVFASRSDQTTNSKMQKTMTRSWAVLADDSMRKHCCPVIWLLTVDTLHVAQILSNQTEPNWNNWATQTYVLQQMQCAVCRHSVWISEPTSVGRCFHGTWHICMWGKNKRMLQCNTWPTHLALNLMDWPTCPHSMSHSQVCCRPFPAWLLTTNVFGCFESNMQCSRLCHDLPTIPVIVTHSLGQQQTPIRLALRSMVWSFWPMLLVQRYHRAHRLSFVLA